MRASLPVATVVGAALSLLSVGLTGCRTGDASFSSTLEGRAFEPGGTVFSYLDAHDENLLEDDDPRVVVAMTWVIFDPTSDLNDLEGSALEDMKHELVLRDAVSLVFDAQKDVDAGSEFQATLAGNDVTDADGVTPRLHFAPERLSADSTYAELAPIASKRTVKIAITAASFGEDVPVLEGTMSVKIEATDADPGDALEGTLEGTFIAPLVTEPTAEQNLALLDVQAELGLPLVAGGG
jgi:hypothetical protein